MNENAQASQTSRNQKRAARLRIISPAQIDDLIELANKRGSAACAATLLEFKNANFPDYDPLAELML